MARALAWHARGHRFDSDILHVALYARAIFDKLIKQKKKRHETRLIRSTAEVCLPHSFFWGCWEKGEKVKKGVRRMPWLLQAMKDVISCEKPGVDANNL